VVFAFSLPPEQVRDFAAELWPEYYRLLSVKILISLLYKRLTRVARLAAFVHGLGWIGLLRAVI